MRAYVLNIFRAIVILANVLLPLNPVVAYAASATDSANLPARVAPAPVAAAPLSPDAFLTTDDFPARYLPVADSASGATENHTAASPSGAAEITPPAGLTLSAPEIVQKFGAPAANSAAIATGNSAGTDLLPAWFELPATENADTSSGTTGDLLPAWFKSDTGSDDAGTSPAMPIAPRETRSTANATIIPQVQVTVEAPPNVSIGTPGGDVYTVTVYNGSASAIASNFYITATIPALGFAYVPGSAQLVTSGGTPIPITEGYTNPQVVWTPSPAFDLQPGATVVLTFTMTTDANAISGQRLDVNAVYDSQGSPGSNNDGVNITVGRGNLVISKSPSNQNATYGDIVSWDVEVANTGLGDVYSVTIGDIPGTGFTNVDTGQNPGFIPHLAIGERFSFPVTATVNSCYSLTNVATGTWNIGNENGTGTTTDPVSDTTDITYQLSPPSLSLASNSLAFSYCTPGAQTVVVTVTNSGGAATNFVLDSDLESRPFSVSNVSAGWVYTAATGEFTPPNGVVTTTQMVLSFDVTPTFDVCSSNDGGISFNARFTDPCDLPFNGPSTTVNYTYATGELPSLSVTKSADRDVTYTGDTMNFTVNFNAQNTQNIDGDIVITDVVPAAMAINAFTPTVGSVVQNGNQLVWTIASGSTAALTGQLDINVTVLDNSGVCAANNIADNTVEARASVTCSTCPDLTSSATASVIVQNAPVGNLDKTVTSDGQICGVLNITNTYALSITDWSNIVFTETLGTRDSVSGLEYMTGTLQVLVNGTDYAVNATIVQTTPQLIVDLNGLTVAGAPTGNNVQLAIVYDIFAPDTVLNGAPSLSFFDWSELYVPGSGAQSCTGDDTFYQGAWIDLQRADLQIAIDPGTTVGCAPTTVTLIVSDADLVANNLVANNIVVTYSVGSPDFDTIDWGSMTYGGGFAGNSVTVVSGSNTITWTFTYPLTQTGTTTGTISFGMNRSCTAPPMDASVSFSDRCDVSYANTTHTAAAISPPDLHLFVTPDTYMLNEQTANWDINVYNGGPGIAYRVLVTDVIGSGLAYNTFTPTVTPAGGATVNLVSSTGGTVVWEVLNMQPGTLVKLAVLVDLVGCTNLTSDVTMDGNCPGESCYPVETDSTNFILPPVSIRSSNAQTADLPFCDTGEVVLTVKNSSATAHIYETIITETIHSLSYVANSARITVTDKTGAIVDGLANVAFEPYMVTSGSDILLVWSLDYTTTTQHDEILTDRAPEDSIQVVFDVQTDCSTPGFNFVRAEAAGLTGCGAFFFRRESAVTLETIQPVITLNKEGRNVTNGETTYSLNVNGQPGDVIEWRITANNAIGAYVARNVLITDTAPSNMNFTGAAIVNGSGIVTQTASGVEWNIGNLPADGTDYVLVITGTVTTGSGSVCELTTNRARLTYGCDAGCRAEPIEATANLQTCPVLSLQLTPATTNNCGGELNFTIVNSGPPAYNVILTDTLPSGYFYASTTFSSTLPTTMPTVGSATPVWGWSVLPTGNTEVHFAVNSGTGGTCGLPSTGQNTVNVRYESAVTYTNHGPYYAGPATAGVTVQQPNLLLTITPAQQNADANQVVTWTITVANTGSGDAQGVLITDVVSTGFDPSTVSASDGSDADETNTPAINTSGTAPNDFAIITWSPAVTIAAGDSWSAVVTATTRNTGVNFNEASISGHCNAGCLYATDIFTAHVTLLSAFDKSPAVQTGTIGSVVTFTLSAALPDIDALYQNVIVTDTLPAGLGFVAATLSYTSDVDGNNNPTPGTQLSGITPTPNPGQYNSGAVVWNLGDLPGTVQVSGVLTAVIQDVSQAYDGAALINRLDMTYLNDGRDYIFTDTAEVDVQEPVLHIGKTYVTPPGCGATLYIENFNTGTGGWESQGTWNITNGIYGASQNTANLRSFNGDTTWTDYSYSFMMRTTDAIGSMGGYVRQQGGNGDTGYRFRWTNTAMLLEHREAGNNSTIATVSGGYIPNHWYHIEMRAIGNTIEVYVDGVLMLSGTDDTYSSGRIGVYASQLDESQFDDVLVTKMDDMGCTIGANQLVTYTLFISNQWTLPGYDLVITDDLPISTSLVSYAFSSDDGTAGVSSGPPAGATGTVVWNVNQLTNESPFTGLSHPGITITVTVQVDDGVPANFILPSQVWLAYDGQPATGPLGIEREYSGGSHSTALRTIPGDLVKTVTFSPQPTATLGTLVTYTIVAPSSPITATLYGVVITDQLQTPQYYIENVSATGGTNPAATFDQAAGLITATFDSIPHDTRATITVTARISHEFPSAATDPNGGDVITNSAVMSYSTGVTESNVVSTDVHEPHVQISKTAAVNGTDPNSMDYTVTVLNNGDADAFDLTVQDRTPDGTTVSNISNGGALLPDGRTISWTISSLAVGASQNLNYQLTLNQSIYTSTLFTNTAIVTNTSLTNTIPGVRPYVTDTVHTFDLPMGRIGDYVWLDADYDGVQGGTNDTPIGGVVVNLYDSAGNFITTTTTAADGSYIFQYLPLSTTYVVQLDTSNFSAGGALQPYTTTQTGQGMSATDSDADANALFLGNGYAITTTLTAAITEDLTLDYGFTALMSLGNQVWYDQNDNGILNALEVGISGVAVELYRDTDGSGDFSAGDTPLGSTTTNAGGYYTFTNLYPGDYVVVITDTNFTGAGALVNYLPSSPTPDGGNADVNNRNHGAASGTLGAGGIVASTVTTLINNTEPITDGDTDANSNLTIDFGFVQRDWGDLPEGPYPTTLAQNGARHIILPTGNPTLGATVDAETNGQPNATATGDDTTNIPDDEDGVTWSPLVAGQTIPFTVTASQATGYLNGWIDFNGNGTFDTGEQVFTDQALSLGANALNVTVPATATTTGLYMRFRYSTQTELFPTGEAPDGEVEDYVTTAIAYDLGDLPDGVSGAPSYPTLLANSGARHLISPTLYLGNLVDAEGDGQPTVGADGDDTIGVIDDEDGVTWTPLVLGQTATFTVTTNSADQGYLNAWIDFNGNGVLDDAGEQIVTDALLNSGVNTFSVSIPADAVSDDLYMRFRYSTRQGLTPTGDAPDGEVEDYVANTLWYDLGDLPDTYGTILASTGARHLISPTLYLGDRVDAEGDGQPTVGADGDDTNATTTFGAAGTDDEDGISWSTLDLGQTAIFTVTSASVGQGLVNGWIDFNGDGDFADAGEQIFTDATLGTGTLTASVTIPLTATTGNLYMRFRYSTQSGLAPTGDAPDGEVEDYVGQVILRDWGDLPEGPYPTTLAQNGARHIILPAGNPTLGATVDDEVDGQPNATATGDDIARTPDDEDGVQLMTPLVAGQVATFTITATNTTDAQFVAWMDFNGDGDFADTGETIFSGISLANGANILTITVPTVVLSDTINARFRYSTQAGLTPTGEAWDGEVEDYQFAPTNLVSLGDLVWFDYNNNGVFESGAGESGVSGVTVELYNAGDAAGTDAPVATATTDANGRYLFTDIPEGGYFVHIPPSQFTAGQPLYGYDSTVPTQTDPNTDQNEDVDENGIPVSGTADVAGVSSGVVTVTVGTEPTGEDVNNIDPTTPDASGNLTVDFGFYAANAGITVVKDVTVTPNVNHATVRYTVTVTNSGQIPLFPVLLTDTLPAELTFVPGTGTPTDPDTVNGQTLGWDNIVTVPLQPGQGTQVGFDAQITAGYTGTFINAVIGTGVYTGGTVTDTGSVPVEVRDPAVDLLKEIVPPGAVNGVITYTITVSNVGPSVLDVVPLFDFYDSTYLTFTVSTPPEDYRARGEIRWNDLTQSFGRNLAPGERFVVTTTFGVIREITQTVNRAVVSGTTDIYVNPAPPITDTVTITNTPTAVDLLYFIGEPVGNTAQLRWATASETDNYAFFIYRAESANRDDVVEISGGIPAEGVGGGGASYSFTDDTVVAGTTYHYWLADMDTAGELTWHPPIELTITADGGIGADFTNWIYLPLIVK